MSIEPAPDDFTLKMARDLGGQGFRVVRVYEGDKRPVGDDWPRLATADVDVLTNQFTPGGLGLGIACGPQPNGRDLVVVDVDTKHDGMANWERIVAEHGPFPVTATHTTPSGGLHLFWDSPETLRNGKLCPGVDIRGDGGQVVVPPSWRLIDGKRVHYQERWKTSGVHRHPIAALPIALWEMLQRPSAIEIAASVTRHPSQNGDGVVSNPDWLRDHWDWQATLEAQGHTLVKVRGDTLYMRHPTATAEHSAVVHLSACMMNAFSTNMPEPLREAQVNRDGSIAWSPFDWFTATDYGGNYSAAMTEIYRRRGIEVRGVALDGRSQGHPPLIDATAHRLPVVEDEYWSASARNRHIFTAARAAMVSPDALDLVMFALESLLIPTNYLLPRIVGGQQPLNMLSCLVAPTGMFKTSTLDAARDLMGPFPPWAIQIGMGSGEGIGATFLEDETEANAKTGKTQKTGRLKRNAIQAAFFEADEGSGLSEQAARNGATIIANLCKAWSGSTLGEANADPAKRRHVLDRDYRIAALINIQPTAFATLFSIANTGTGLTGRFMFSGTADYDIPDEDTPWPGVLDHPVFARMPVTLEIDEEIIAAAKATIRQRHRSASLQTTIDAVGQNAAVIARMAGIAVLVDDRRRITSDDWALAEMRARTSAACLQTLSLWSASVKSDAGHKQAAAKGELEYVVESVKERKYIAAMAEAIRRKVADGPIGRNKVARAVSSGSTRHRFDAALALAIGNGWVAVDEDRLEPT